MSIEPPIGGQPTGSQPPSGGRQPRYARRLVIGGAIVAVAVIAVIAAVLALASGDGDKGEVVSGSPAADEFATFSGLVARAEEALNNTRVVYSVKSVADGEVFEGEWVLAQRLPSESRVEINAEDSQIIVITGIGPSAPQSGVGTTVTHVCIVFEGPGSCLTIEASAAEAITAPVNALYAISQELASTASQEAISVSKGTIAGQSATCYTVETPDSGEGEVCFSSNPGLLLRVSFKENLFEATSVGEARDEDFECCPFEVIESLQPQITVEPPQVTPTAP